MPKNPIQFQKGQSLAAFLEACGTEPNCEQALFQARWPHGVECPACGYGKHCKLRTRKVLQCIRCKHRASLTAGTLLENTKLPLRTWFLAMCRVSQSKHGIPAMELMRRLGVSYSTAWGVRHKLMQSLREREDRQPLAGTVELDDACLGGESSGKRGRGAAGKTPFVAAAEGSEDGRPLRLRLSC